jgi:hypothetical protein
LLLKLDRTEVVQNRVTPTRIVKAFDVVEHIGPGLVPAAVLPSGAALGLSFPGRNPRRAHEPGDSVQATGLFPKQQSAKGSDDTTDKAAAAVRDALESAQQAMLALPDYSS